MSSFNYKFITRDGGLLSTSIIDQVDTFEKEFIVIIKNSSGVILKWDKCKDLAEMEKVKAEYIAVVTGAQNGKMHKPFWIKSA